MIRKGPLLTDVALALIYHSGLYVRLDTSKESNTRPRNSNGVQDSYQRNTSNPLLWNMYILWCALSYVTAVTQLALLNTTATTPHTQRWFCLNTNERHTMRKPNICIRYKQHSVREGGQSPEPLTFYTYTTSVEQHRC